jgi:hypothetical protein
MRKPIKSFCFNNQDHLLKPASISYAFLRTFISALLGILMLASGAAQTAEITNPAHHLRALQNNDHEDPTFPTDPVKCDLVLDGDIKKGDAKVLEEKLHEIEGTWNAIAFFLCLKSKGGDVQEALAISRFIRSYPRPSIATIVEDGQTCASACALAFMAGGAPNRVGATPLRFLHPRAKLEFHSTFIPLDSVTDADISAWLRDKNVPQVRSTLTATFDNGLRNLQSIISTFNNLSYSGDKVGQPWVRPSLFMEVFAQSKSELLCIDSVDKIGRWNINLFGFSPPSSLTKRMQFNACRNVYYWRADELATRGLDAPPKNADITILRPPLQRKIGGRDVNMESEYNLGDKLFNERVIVDDATIYAQRDYQQCVIEVDNTGKTSLHPQSRITIFYISDNERQSELFRYDPTVFFHPATPLPELARTPVQSRHREPSAFDRTKYDGKLMEGCDYRRTIGGSLDACESACANDAQCQAYSYNNWTKSCHLKHTINDLRLDPAWITGAQLPAGQSAMRESIRARVLDPEYSSPRLVGTEIETRRTSSSRECARNCDSFNGCVGYSYYESNHSCHTFRSIQTATESNEQIESSVWRQK